MDGLILWAVFMYAVGIALAWGYLIYDDVLKPNRGTCPVGRIMFMFPIMAAGSWFTIYLVSKKSGRW